MQMNILSEDKVIITAAITGGLHGKAENPNMPISPEEQAQASRDCYNAGASVLHLHVRDDEGKTSKDINTYNKAVTLIGEKCPIIRQIGNGIGHKLDDAGNVVSPTLEDRLKLLTISPQTEMHTINAGTFGFRVMGVDNTFENPTWFNERYLNECHAQDIGVEIEVYDLSHINNAVELYAKAGIKARMHFSLVLGIGGGTPASAENMMHMVSQLPEGSTWQVVTVGKYHLRSTMIAMALGGNARTGMEDTIFYRRNEPVESNAQLVERLVRYAREIGREPATVEEAKVILGLSRYARQLVFIRPACVFIAPCLIDIQHLGFRQTNPQVTTGLSLVIQAVVNNQSRSSR